MRTPNSNPIGGTCGSVEYEQSNRGKNPWEFGDVSDAIGAARENAFQDILAEAAAPTVETMRCGGRRLFGMAVVGREDEDRRCSC